MYSPDRSETATTSAGLVCGQSTKEQRTRIIGIEEGRHTFVMVGTMIYKNKYLKTTLIQMGTYCEQQCSIVSEQLIDQNVL